MRTAYLDHNATSPIRPEAAEAVARALAIGGNPSSVHAAGRAARRLIDDSRDAVAALVGADPTGVIFTSGATEANALALRGLGRSRVLASAVEHPSVLKAAAAETVPVDGDGVIDLAALEAMLARSHEPALVAVMLANNETGAIQPVPEVVGIARAHGALVHCDAVQAAGRMELDIRALGVDSLALSAHKLGGPMGVGALILADPDARLSPMLAGGAQEMRRRAGTENLPGIAGFAAAARDAVSGMEAESLRQRELRDRLEALARGIAPSLVVFAADADRLPNTSCLALPGLPARTLVIALDLAGVAVSAGAACSSGRVETSHVLAAMGAGELAGSAIRASLGWNSRTEDVEAFAAAFAPIARRHDGRAARAA